MILPGTQRRSQGSKAVPLWTPAETKIFMLLSASVKRFGVSGMRNFFVALFGFLLKLIRVKLKVTKLLLNTKNYQK